MDTRYTSEGQVYRDADHITRGASNPLAVSKALSEMLVFLSRQGLGSDELKAHAAIRVTLDHLNCIVFGGNHPATHKPGETSYLTVMLESERYEGGK